MRVVIDQEGMVLITEAELLRCYRSALLHNKHVASQRRGALQKLPLVMPL